MVQQKPVSMIKNKNLIAIFLTVVGLTLIAGSFLEFSVEVYQLTLLIVGVLVWLLSVDFIVDGNIEKRGPDNP